MNDTMMGAIIGVAGTLLGVVATGGLTLWQARRRDKQERDSVRTLISLEVLQNATGLLIFRTALERTLDYEDARHVAVAFLITAVPPQWEKVRWNAPEAGRHLTPSELMRIGEWYTRLDSLTYLYHRLMEQIRRVPVTDGKLSISGAAGDGAAQQIRSLLNTAEELRTDTPPLPDAKLSRGESVRDYLADLVRRLPKKDGESEASA